MYDCTSSNHGQSFCSGTMPNGFRSIKVLTCRTHPKLLTARKVPKKKKKNTGTSGTNHQTSPTMKTRHFNHDQYSRTRNAFKQPSPPP
uniref:Uncharacterized protein n=1 Tax=Romanomermis culicivorax TaxID=13658 RepID=A0A915ICX5_ROMCU